MFTKHHPNGDGSHHFDNARLESLIASYQAGLDPAAALTEIVELTQRRALTLIRFNNTTKYVPESELLSDINCKLLKAVGRFDSRRGSGFTFLSCLIQNTLRSNVTNARKAAARRVELDETITSKLVTDGESPAQEADEDLADRIRRGVKTTLDDPEEIAMQRWYVEGFIDGAAELRRYQCANAAMRGFGLSHDRSRELYDLTLLEVRRLLYGDLKHRAPIPPGRLLGTRGQWMLRYVPLLTAEEFTKFVTLARDLSPFILLLIAPQSRSRRQDRNQAITRQNLEWVLDGHPAATPLFPQ
jgi:hypothetical protein